MPSSVAVLGATGVYGRHLVPRLVARGFRVRALVRRPEAAKIVIHPAVGSGAVLDQCGPPTVEGPLRREVVWIRNGDAWREVVVDRMTWAYDRGPREFVRLLHFENDTVKVIELGGYDSR